MKQEEPTVKVFLTKKKKCKPVSWKLTILITA
jgi:hypothetical protein